MTTNQYTEFPTGEVSYVIRDGILYLTYDKSVKGAAWTTNPELAYAYDSLRCAESVRDAIGKGEVRVRHM